MKKTTDLAGDARRAWLGEMQQELVPVKSDFETSLAFRLVLIVAVVVISINVLAPAPVTAHASASHPTV